MWRAQPLCSRLPGTRYEMLCMRQAGAPAFELITGVADRSRGISHVTAPLPTVGPSTQPAKYATSADKLVISLETVRQRMLTARLLRRLLRTPTNQRRLRQRFPESDASISLDCAYCFVCQKSVIGVILFTCHALRPDVPFDAPSGVQLTAGVHSSEASESAALMITAGKSLSHSSASTLHPIINSNPHQRRHLVQ